MKQMAKKVTLGIMVIAFFGGLIGAFIEGFNMDGYTSFLKSFVPFFSVMIASIGTNSAITKIQISKGKVDVDKD